jgi:NADPH:quinone reductase-like Zn-dependent oxidoreductase
VEVAGGANLGKSILALAPGGRISLIGVIEGFDSTFPSVPAIFAHATIQAVYVGHRRGLENFVRAVDAIKLKPEIGGEFQFSELPAALEAFAKGAFGKVVLNL